MNFINFKALSEYFERTVADLKQETYASLEALEAQMRREKAEDEARRNVVGAEYIRLLKKYFTMWHLLTSYWTEAEVIAAASKHMSVRELVSEVPVRQGHKYWDDNAEYIRTSWYSLPRSTKGEGEHMESERVMCDIYRVKNQYQRLQHGKIVLELLYSTFPELMQFGFEAYGMDYEPEEKYEIYPKNHIYTPFQALLSGDIETIKKRNLTYGTSRNFGEYTVSKVKERLSGEEAGHYFEVIQGLDRTKLRGLKENDEKETA